MFQETSFSGPLISDLDKEIYSKLIKVLVNEFNIYSEVLCVYESGTSGNLFLEESGEFWDLSELKNRLKDEGLDRFSFIGNGSFSLVFMDNLHNAVLKISLGQDDIANLYWEFCSTNQASYLPTIFAMGSQVHGDLVVDWCVQPFYSHSDRYVRELLKETDYALIAEMLFPSLLEWVSASGYILDLHADNVRENHLGQFVVTDAICLDPETVENSDYFN